MPFVLDTSVTMAWCFDDEVTPYDDYVQDLLVSDLGLAPSIWPLEVANAVYMGERRGRLTMQKAVRFIDLLSGFPIVVDVVSVRHVLDRTLSLARTYQLTCYDAAYLELAIREGAPIATRDKRLVEAAMSAGVPLVE
jgi:predicted nucleic acid-binding protein